MMLLHRKLKEASEQKEFTKVSKAVQAVHCRYTLSLQVGAKVTLYIGVCRL